MKLKGYNLKRLPPANEELLMLIDIGRDDYYLWTVGTWTEKGWCCPFDNVGYMVIKWYILPHQMKEK